jgi:hypothetical protein
MSPVLAAFPAGVISPAALFVAPLVAPFTAVTTEATPPDPPLPLVGDEAALSAEAKLGRLVVVAVAAAVALLVTAAAGVLACCR